VIKSCNKTPSKTRAQSIILYRQLCE